MITQVILPIHSFVDLITNSSSEIFVAADKNTVKTIKSLVENLIAASGGTVTVDDLFEFDLVYVCFDHNYDEVWMTKSELKSKRKEIQAIIDDDTGKYTEEQVKNAEAWEFGDGESEYPQLRVRVTAKDSENKNAKIASKILSNLTDLFQIEASYG